MKRAANSVAGETGTKATILAADDDRKFLEEVKEILENEGYDVITATNPFDAKRILGQGLVDLALLDIRLTDMNDEKDRSGLIIAREVAPQIPKILVTSYLPYRDPSEAKGLPANVSFVSKQAGLNTIVYSVKSTLASIKRSSAPDGREEETALKGLAEMAPKEKRGFEKSVRAKWLAQKSPIIALILLLLALLAGVLAMVLENPILLIGTVAAAILAVVFIGLSISIE